MIAPAAVRSIPFFDYSAVFTSEEQELVAIFRDAGRRGAFVMQQDLRRFERNLAQFLGASHVLGVANATDGLEIALRAAHINQGDEVIFCSHTMAATAAAIHFAGGIPVPVECGADHLMDPRAAAEAVTPRTRAILPTQLNGRTADMDALGAIAERHGLILIEDAAQALGSRFRGRAAGTFGAAAAVSFYPAKVLGCLGDGGAVITSDEGMREKMSALRNHGCREDGEIVSWGFNSRLDNLQAAILDHRLRSYQAVMLRRRAIARLYRQRLESVEELALPPGPNGDPDHFDVFQNYEIEALYRAELRVFLQRRGVGTVLPWGGKAVHQWERLGFRHRLPYTEGLFERILMLPMNLALADEDVEYICDRVIEFYRGEFYRGDFHRG